MRSCYRDGAALRGMIASVQALHSVRLPAPGRAGKNRLDVNTLGQGKPQNPSPCGLQMEPSFMTCGPLLSAAVNLAIACAGAGILSFPYAFSLSGAAATSLFVFLVLAMNICTLDVLVYAYDVSLPSPAAEDTCSGCAQRQERSAAPADDGLDGLKTRLVAPACSCAALAAATAASSGGRTYEAVVAHVLGATVGRLANGIVFLIQFGSLVGFLCVMTDCGLPALRTVIGPADSGPPPLWLRASFIFGVALLVLLPLSCVQRIHNLAATSLLAVLAVLLRCTASQPAALRRNPLRCNVLRCVAIRCAALQSVVLRCRCSPWSLLRRSCLPAASQPSLPDRRQTTPKQPRGLRRPWGGRPQGWNLRCSTSYGVANIARCGNT